MFVDLAKVIDEPSIDIDVPVDSEKCKELLSVLHYYRGYALLNKSLRKLPHFIEFRKVVLRARLSGWCPTNF